MSNDSVPAGAALTSAIDWWLRISSSVIAIPLMCVQMAAASDPQIAPASRSDFSGDWVLESASQATSTSYGVNWDGNALVFENESHSERVDAATWNERREVWSLDETGRLQIVITNRGWDGPARRLTLLYRRP